MYRIMMILVGWGIVAQLGAVNFHDFDEYQNKFTSKHIKAKIRQYLQKDALISRFYQVTPDALYIGNIKDQQIDYILHLARAPSLVYQRPIKSGLRDTRIALDPGHFGGMLAQLEDRYIHIPAEHTPSKHPIYFDEGTLTYSTAVILKELLEAEGAIVFMTRSGIARGAMKETFFEWLASTPGVWSNKESLSQLFRNYYNRADLKLRAQEINAFAPDLTIIIHYNAHLTDQEKKEAQVITKTNYNLTFIPGAFCQNELDTLEDRYEFLRLLLTDDIEESEELSSHIIQELVEQLDVPVIPKNEKTSYLESGCLFQEPGVYCRNLVLTRLVHGPLCYGETLIQNNQDELLRLSKNDVSIGGLQVPARVKQVADAYFDGIKNYVTGKMP